MIWFARLMALGLLLISFAGAQELVSHEETVQLGAYSLKVQFSQWPIRAERSLDILVIPDGGIQGLSGQTRLTLLGSKQVIESNLVRFPKNRNFWGYDLISIPKEGTWNLELRIKGAKGTGVGNLKFEVFERPAGPSVALTQPLGLIPIMAMLILAIRAWRRVRPVRHVKANQW